MATELQLKLLNHIAYDEYTQFNGARPDEPVQCWLWADEIAAALGITVQAAKGVIGSAVEAGLVHVTDNGPGEDNAIGMTTSGYEAWNAAYPEDLSNNAEDRPMTKKQLQQALTAAGVPFKSKASKIELEKLLADAKEIEAEALDGRTEPERFEVEGLPVEEVADPAPTKPAKKKAAKKKAHKPGAKMVLRERFAKHGAVTPKQLDKIVADLGCSKATVLTAISDLKNAKYAGAAGPLAIRKDEDGTFRLAK